MKVAGVEIVRAILVYPQHGQGDHDNARDGGRGGGRGEEERKWCFLTMSAKKKRSNVSSCYYFLIKKGKTKQNVVIIYLIMIIHVYVRQTQSYTVERICVLPTINAQIQTPTYPPQHHTSTLSPPSSLCP